MNEISWPSWMYGPNGASMICNGPEEVPEGWVDSPAKVGQQPEPAPKKKGKPAPVEEPKADNGDA